MITYNGIDSTEPFFDMVGYLEYVYFSELSLLEQAFNNIKYCISLDLIANE